MTITLRFLVTITVAFILSGCGSDSGRNRKFLAELLDTVDRYYTTQDNLGWERRFAAINSSGVSDPELTRFKQDCIEAHQRFSAAVASGVSHPPETQDQAASMWRSVNENAAAIGALLPRADSLAQKYGIPRTHK